VAPAGTPRILVSGSPMALPNWKLHYVLESAGAVVVGEESCVGSRYSSTTTPPHQATLDGQIDAITQRMMGTHCACFTPNGQRLDDIAGMARDLQADGVIHYGLQFCQLYTIEGVRVERALAQQGMPVLRIETDYADEDMGQLRTRVEAFLEMVRA
jgi:benzoyl-CoA reductase/2-hydroxyglutaryl-CoA dehydratase subunit BcrC/BadD/HgdB